MNLHSRQIPLHHSLEKVVDDMKLLFLKCARVVTPFLLFRAVHGKDIYKIIREPNAVLHHRTPFSTTISLKYAEEWLYGYKNRIILIILLDGNQAHINFGGGEFEVLLPSGKVSVCNFLSTINDIDYYLCKFCVT